MRWVASAVSARLLHHRRLPAGRDSLRHGRLGRGWTHKCDSRCRSACRSEWYRVPPGSRSQTCTFEPVELGQIVSTQSVVVEARFPPLLFLRLDTLGSLRRGRLGHRMSHKCDSRCRRACRSE